MTSSWISLLFLFSLYNFFYFSTSQLYNFKYYDKATSRMISYELDENNLSLDYRLATSNSICQRILQETASETDKVVCQGLFLQDLRWRITYIIFEYLHLNESIYDYENYAMTYATDRPIGDPKDITIPSLRGDSDELIKEAHNNQFDKKIILCSIGKINRSFVIEFLKISSTLYIIVFPDTNLLEIEDDYQSFVELARSLQCDMLIIQLNSTSNLSNDINIREKCQWIYFSPSFELNSVSELEMRTILKHISDPNFSSIRVIRLQYITYRISNTDNSLVHNYLIDWKLFYIQSHRRNNYYDFDRNLFIVPLEVVTNTLSTSFRLDIGYYSPNRLILPPKSKPPGSVEDNIAQILTSDSQTTPITLDSSLELSDNKPIILLTCPHRRSLEFMISLKENLQKVGYHETFLISDMTLSTLDPFEALNKPIVHITSSLFHGMKYTKSFIFYAIYPIEYQNYHAYRQSLRLLFLNSQAIWFTSSTEIKQYNLLFPRFLSLNNSNELKQLKTYHIPFPSMLNQASFKNISSKNYLQQLRISIMEELKVNSSLLVCFEGRKDVTTKITIKQLNKLISNFNSSEQLLLQNSPEYQPKKIHFLTKLVNEPGEALEEGERDTFIDQCHIFIDFPSNFIEHYPIAMYHSLLSRHKLILYWEHTIRLEEPYSSFMVPYHSYDQLMTLLTSFFPILKNNKTDNHE